MRISLNKKDFGFFKFKKLIEKNDIKIFFDEKEIKNCITVDEEKGYVLKFAEDEEGKPVLNEKRTAALKVRLYGNVRIETIKKSKA